MDVICVHLTHCAVAQCKGTSKEGVSMEFAVLTFKSGVA